MTVAITPTALPIPEALAREITLLAGQINAANHRLLKLIAAFDKCEGYSGGGTVRSCAHWLNWQCGIALGAAREKVRVAHCLEQLPRIDAAFARGEISYSKVRAMTRVATPETEDYLLMIARHGTASHVENVVRKYKAVRRALDGKAEEEQFASRELLYYQDEQGMWVIHARLPAEAGELVVKAIEASVALERERDEETEDAENVSAETFSGEQARPPPPQARADALERLAERFITSPRDNTSLKGHERCQIQLQVSLSALQGAGDSSPLRRLCCDASLVTVLEDEQGRVLNIGRRSRTVPPAIRRALALRDNNTCRVPGCCESRYVVAVHIVHWAVGGETSLSTLVTLCRHHHRALHQGVFTLEA
ncbi:MAG: DUF222 domain-containing protein, partial [Halioglobus sp.]|nr:DUF222 domain-containing protein [Halioglobus sp.]